MKRKWVIILSICVVIAFVVQIMFYLIFIKKFVGNSDLSVDSIANRRAAIQEFLIVCDKYDAKVVPADRQSLLGFHSLGTKYFAHFVDNYDGPVSTFITFNEVFDNKVVVALTERGFYHASLSQPDAKLWAQNIVVHRLLHHVFLKNHFAVHVVVCYHRDSNFWWFGRFNFGQLTPSSQIPLTAKDFHFAQDEGAFNEFPILFVKKDPVKIYLPRNITNFLAQLNYSRFIECNHTRANLFYSQFQMDTSENAMTFRALAWKLLSTTKTALDKLGIRFWLSSGTCLGYFRQCDIFPYSKDVDIGIWIKDYNPLILTSLLATGMNLKHKLGKVDDSLELSFMFEDIKLDIFFFYEEGDYVWNGGLQTRTGNKYKYTFPKFDLCWTEFLGLKVSVPCQTESYIIANYGSNWFQPVEKWDWKTSPFNVQFNGVWPEEEWNEVIQVADI